MRYQPRESGTRHEFGLPRHDITQSAVSAHFVSAKRLAVIARCFTCSLMYMEVVESKRALHTKGRHSFGPKERRHAFLMRLLNPPGDSPGLHSTSARRAFQRTRSVSCRSETTHQNLKFRKSQEVRPTGSKTLALQQDSAKPKRVQPLTMALHRELRAFSFFTSKETNLIQNWST